MRPQRKDGHLENSSHQTLMFFWTPVIDPNLQNWKTYISELSKHLAIAVQTGRRCRGWRKGKGMKRVETAAASTMLEGAVHRIWWSSLWAEARAGLT